MGKVFGETRQLGKTGFQALQHLVQCIAQRLQLTQLGSFVDTQMQMLDVDGQRTPG